MAIPESQLETWSHQGAVTTSSNTYNSIRGTLKDANAPYAGKDFDVFLQGSYGNDTNIRADSDVDVVIQLNSTFHQDLSQLPPEQIAAYQQNFSNATYGFSDFRREVVSHLQSTYGSTVAVLGKKAVKIGAASGRLVADVIVCCQYRYYRSFYSSSNQQYDEGIYLQASNGETVINYPKQHSTNCTAKHQATSQWFKPTVRMFKNMRGRLIDNRAITLDNAPSYFIEGLLYNVPDDQFGQSLNDTFCNCVNWLRKTDRSKFVCANGKVWFFGNSSVQWSQDNCVRFLDSLVGLWNGW